MTAESDLLAWCEARAVAVTDYRDLKLWPRRKVYDASQGHGYPLNKMRAEPSSRVPRPWSRITTLVLHTTAVAGMTAPRGLGIPAHLYLPAEPAVVLCHALELRLAHAHAANSYSIGLEISGVSAWDSAEQVERARALIRYFAARRREEIGPDARCYIAAHRMSHDSRVNDPGREIWLDAGEWAIDELGFELGPVVGTGRGVDGWRRS